MSVSGGAGFEIFSAFLSSSSFSIHTKPPYHEFVYFFFKLAYSV